MDILEATYREGAIAASYLPAINVNKVPATLELQKMNSSRMAEKSGASSLNFAEILNIDSTDTRGNLMTNGSKEREKSPSPFMQLQVEDKINIENQEELAGVNPLKRPARSRLSKINTDNLNSPSVANLLNEDNLNAIENRKIADSPTMVDIKGGGES